MNIKKTTFFLLISISLNSFAQDIFTDALAGEYPSALHVVDNDLYVGTITSKKLYNISIDDPAYIQFVTEFSDSLWKMDYDPLHNDFYCNSFDEFLIVDLDQSPVTPMTIMNLSTGNGLEIHNNIIYVAHGPSVYTYDIAVGISSYQLLFTDTDGDIIRNPRIYNNELYYQLQIFGDPTNLKIYKINIANPGAQKVVVTPDLGGGSQSSVLVDNFLYLGLESAGKLVRLDLSDTNLPLTPVVLLEINGAGIIGLANKNSTIFYATGFQIIHTYNDPILSTNSKIQSPVSISPNPTSELIYLNGTSLNDIPYSVYSPAGINLKEGLYSDAINISELARGIYFLVINQNGNMVTKKIIKTDR